jgi:putative transposase
MARFRREGLHIVNPILAALIAFLAASLRPRLSLQLEIVALRHQLAVYRRSVRRPRLQPADRILWSWILRRWSRWRDVLIFVRPASVTAWQRRRFRDHWAKLSRRAQPGRPSVPQELITLIRTMSSANPCWGSPRILGELQKLGIKIAKSVEKYRVRHRKPPSPTWRTFLRTHTSELVAIDFFTVPTVRFTVLFVLLVLAHDRRRVIHFNVTANPTAQRTAQQMVEAFPWDSAPKYLLRDRDASYGDPFRRRLPSMRIEQVLTSPRSPWQNPYVERLIGSIRRDCLDHVIVLSQRHLRRTLASYLHYYHRWRTHLSLDMDCPDPRPVHSTDRGTVVEFPEVGGLHHHYERLAA